MPLDAKAEAFWQAYLASSSEAEDAVRRFYEVFQIGDTPEGANDGVALIKQGVKTATSSLLWTYEALNKPLPEVGSLSIVTDGGGGPGCVVETIAVDIKGFAEVDAAFAYDYGEWDRTLETWRARCWEFYSPHCLREDTDARDAAGLRTLYRGLPVMWMNTYPLPTRLTASAINVLSERHQQFDGPLRLPVFAPCCPCSSPFLKTGRGRYQSGFCLQFRFQLEIIR